MGPVSVSSQSSQLNTLQNRVDSTNPQFRDTQTVRERLDVTKPTGTDSARSQKAETRNYKESDKLASADSETTQQSKSGNRRGGILDISV